MMEFEIIHSKITYKMMHVGCEAVEATVDRRHKPASSASGREIILNLKIEYKRNIGVVRFSRDARATFGFIFNNADYLGDSEFDSVCHLRYKDTIFESFLSM